MSTEDEISPVSDLDPRPVEGSPWWWFPCLLVTLASVAYLAGILWNTLEQQELLNDTLDHTPNYRDAP